jgi:hypothetical protein
MRFNPPRIIVTSLLPVIAACALSGCQTTAVHTSDGRPMPPDPRPAPRTPTDAVPNAMAMRVGAKPLDTNNNGFPDLIEVESFLFAEPHPTPMFADGTFVFELFLRGQALSDDATPIARWVFTGKDLQRSRVLSDLFGPSYRFNLSLFEVGGDEFPLTGADLTGRFEPGDGGDAVRCRGVRSIQIGRRDA